MAPIALGSLSDRYIHSNGTKKLEQPQDGFGTRAVHVGSDPDASTGAVIPAISLSTTYKQHGIGNHKVSVPVGGIPELLRKYVCLVRVLNILGRQTPIGARLSRHWPRSNREALMLLPLPRVLLPPLLSFSPLGPTHTSSA